LTPTHCAPPPTVGVWGAALVPSGDPVTLTPLTVLWTTTGNDATSYLEVVNVGTLRLDSQTLVVTVTVTQGGGAPDPVAFTACVGAAWDITTDSCAGTAQLLGTSQQAPLATGVTVAPGARLSIRAATRKNTASRTDTTIGVRVVRSDVRPATVTNG
jgi:hypothetical protein